MALAIRLELSQLPSYLPNIPEPAGAPRKESMTGRRTLGRSNVSPVGEGSSRGRISVRVHPPASRARHVWDGERLELWVRQSPVAGAANDAVLRAVSVWLGINASQVQLVWGRTSHSKVA